MQLFIAWVLDKLDTETQPNDQETDLEAEV